MNPRGPGSIAMTLRLFVENMAVSWLCLSLWTFSRVMRYLLQRALLHNCLSPTPQNRPSSCSMNAPFKADKTNNGSRRRTLGENKENPASPKQYYSKMLWKLYTYA